MSLLWTCFLFAPVDAPPAERTSYARPALLVEAADLARRLSPQVHVLDARPRAAYDVGHVPGAVWVNAEDWARTFAADRDPVAWSWKIGSLGLVPGGRVVLLDDVSGRDAARLWWVLRYWGVPDAALLNGGWTAWKAARGPVATEETKPVPWPLPLDPAPARLAVKADVLAVLKSPNVQIVDARSAGEFCGDKKLARRGGAIPGARHLDWEDLVDPGTRRFKPAAELARLFREHEIRLDRPAVTYCQSGGRASVMAFALELMGADQVRNYYRSWAEWGNAEDTPVDTPPKKK